MKPYYGRRVMICERPSMAAGMVPTGKTGLLLEIDVANEHVMIEDENGNIVKLYHRLVKFI